MKKSRIIVIIVCAFVLVVAVGIRIYLYNTPKKVINFSKEEITRAYITNGNNGKTTELTGDNLELMYNDFKDISIKSIIHRYRKKFFGSI